MKAFITHGGLLSTIESICYGVPVVGIPVFADQKMNMAGAVANGFGVEVDYSTLSEETLGSALNEVLHNPKYVTCIILSSILIRAPIFKITHFTLSITFAIVLL